MMNRNLIFVVVSFAMMIMSCGQELTPNEESQDVALSSAGLRVSTDLLCSDERFWSGWEAVKDKIGVFLNSGTNTLLANQYLYAFSSTNSSKFVSSNLNWSSYGESNIYAYYPYRSSYNDMEAIPCSLNKIQRLESDVLPDIKKKTLLFGKVEGYIGGNELPNITLYPAVAVVNVALAVNRSVKLSQITVSTDSTEPLAFSEGSLNLKTGVITPLADISSELTLIPDNVLITSASGLSFSFLINQVSTATKLYIKGLVGKEEILLASLDIPEDGLKAGYLYSYSPEFELPEIETICLSENGSANTYIINKASSTYSFSVTSKGNGVSRDFAWTFDGEPCNISWSDVTLAPSEVKVLWYNTPMNEDGQWVDVCPIDIESLNYDNVTGLVTFNTPDVFVEGNVLVAAFDQSGEIIWSWNLWAVKDYVAENNARQVGRFTVMDRNLGSFSGVEAAKESNSIKAARSIGNFYQWGRKDPLPAAGSFSSSQSPSWGIPTYTPLQEYKQSGNLIYTENRVQNVYCLGKDFGNSFTLQEAVEASVSHPHKSMANGTSDNADPYHWALPSYSKDEKYKTTSDRSYWRTLWGSVDGYNSVKTIFDPCPPGWKVPTVDLYVYAFAGASKSSNGYGYYSDKFDLFMPCAGQRTAGFGGSNFSAVGEAAMYCSATANDSYTPMRGAESGMTAYNSYGGASYQLRCVKEEVSASAPSVGMQTGKTAVLMGDSITEQWPIRGRKAFFTENNYEGVGISGQTSRDMLDRFYNDVLSKSAQVVVVAGGTNDLAYNDGVKTCREDVLNNVMLMIELARAWGSEVIVGSSFPSRHYWWNTGASFWTLTPDEIAQGSLELAKILKAYAESNGYKYADYFTALADEENNLADEYCYNFGSGWQYAADGLDRVHPGAAGYLVMENVLKPLIDAALNHPDQIIPGGAELDDMDKVEW